MPNNLFVSYRPSAADSDTAKIHRALESLGKCIQVQDLFWYVNSNKSAEEARDVIRDNIDPADSLIILDVSNNKFEMNRSLRERVESQLSYVWEE